MALFFDNDLLDGCSQDQTRIRPAVHTGDEEQGSDLFSVLQSILGHEDDDDDFNNPLASLDTSLDHFVSMSGGWRPAVPCDYCQTMRMQCLVLQTTPDNPNPITSCSSCAALFKSCSLAEKTKRQPATFETAEPVTLGQLHGVTEDDLFSFFDAELGIGVLQDQGSITTATKQPALDTSSHKRSASRHVSRTKALRDWFVAHSDNPYPTNEEKDTLSRTTGLSLVQVVNWFANARRRQRQSSRATRRHSRFSYGSPMPSPTARSMSPMQRWRNSPPDQEGASIAAIEKAIGDPAQAVDWQSASRISSGGSSVSSLADMESYDSGLSYASSMSHTSSQSGFGEHSFDFLGTSSGQPKLDYRMQSAAISHMPKPTTKDRTRHICKTCSRHFKKRSDLTRHESSIHSASKRSWVCSLPTPADQSLVVWSIESGVPQCLLCGCSAPDEAHLGTHEFDACGERNLSDRTFTRKDHLWQHLRKFHGCKRWEGWTPDLERLSHDADTSG
ncbi:hypothetical protein Micbo1qcDRAFT_150182 [Microdochium bolleyi]|uniref:Homeobox and C2H2 transcription factor n=1 Tax=Microdochium bolleyi TaxID=196109 RepID=A0A136IVR4_9PEZI|nr:hypothetical protein Micbo1qcDRAFT_150182 [Microdochium bolleyi]